MWKGMPPPNTTRLKYYDLVTLFVQFSSFIRSIRWRIYDGYHLLSASSSSLEQTLLVSWIHSSFFIHTKLFLLISPSSKGRVDHEIDRLILGFTEHYVSSLASVRQHCPPSSLKWSFIGELRKTWSDVLDQVYLFTPSPVDEILNLSIRLFPPVLFFYALWYHLLIMLQ